MFKMRHILLSILVLCSLAVTAEDVTFMNNRRQWEKLPSTTLLQMGRVFVLAKERPDSALLCYSIMANRYNENLKGEELEQCIRATCYIGIVYLDCYHNYQEAYRYLLKAQDLAKRHEYTRFMPRILLLLGDIHWKQCGFQSSKDNERSSYILSLNYGKKAFQMAFENQQWDILSPVMINLVFISYMNGDTSDIEAELDKYQSSTIPDSIPMNLFAKSLIHAVELIESGDLQEALDALHSLPIDKELSEHDRINLQVIASDFIYRILLLQNNTSEALKEIKRTEQFILQNEPALILGTYIQYSEVYKALGNNSLAEKYELLWYHSVDSIAQACGANSLNTVRFLHEIDKMNEEVKVLTYKEHTKERILWMVAAFALIALLLLVLLYISRRRIQEGYQRLYRQNVELLAADEARRHSMEAEPAPVAKYSHNQMDEDVMDELWLQIKRVMETSEDIYHDPFGVDQLVELLGAKRNYVSQTINTKTCEAFNVMLNEYRIREACRRMNDLENYGNYSVEGIAQSVGYGSRSHFAKLFKAATGIPPSVYMRMCKAGTPPSAITPS